MYFSTAASNCLCARLGTFVWATTPHANTSERTNIHPVRRNLESDGAFNELFRYSCAVGALLAGASEDEVRRMGDYGEALGLAFQISDDLLDAEEDDEEREASPTPSFPALLGEDLARQRCQELLDRCLELLDDLGDEAEPLRLLAWYAVHRDH